MSMEKFREWMKVHFGTATVVVLAMVHMSAGFLRVDATGKTIGQIIGDSLMYFVLLLSMERILFSQGIAAGRRDPLMQSTKREHGAAVEAVAGWMYALDAWCADKTREGLRERRRRILEREGLDYDDCFDERGRVKPYVPLKLPPELRTRADEGGRGDRERRRQRRAFSKQEKRRFAAYEAACAVSITPLVSGALTVSTVKWNDPYDFGDDLALFSAKQSFKSVMRHLCLAVLFGCYTVSMIKDPDVAELILKLFEIAAAACAGAMSYNCAYTYEIDRERSALIRKIDLLQMFKTTMEKDGGKAILKKEDGAQDAPERTERSIYERTSEKGDHADQ